MLTVWTVLVFCVLWWFVYLAFSVAFSRRIRVQSRMHTYLASENGSQQKVIEEEDITEPFRVRVLYPLLHGMSQRLGRLAPTSLEKRVGLRLQQAGNPLNLSAREWLGLQGILTIAGFVAGVIFTPVLSSWRARIMVFVTLVLIPFLISELILSSRIRERRTNMKRALPDVLDLLTVSVEAGLGFDQALGKVVEKIKGSLSEEFAKALQEIQYGKSRRDSLKDMSERVAVDNVTQFVNALLQADRLGVSIGNVLRVQAVDMRVRRRQEAEEKAMKAPVKILFPLIFFVFPSLFVIILGPAVINIVTKFMS